MSEGRGGMPSWSMWLAGGAIGAGIGMLIAPKSGPRIRRDIAHFGSKCLHRSQEAASEISYQVDDLMDEISMDLHDRLGNMPKETKRGLERALRNGREYIQREIREMGY